MKAAAHSERRTSYFNSAREMITCHPSEMSWWGTIFISKETPRDVDVDVKRVLRGVDIRTFTPCVVDFHHQVAFHQDILRQIALY